MAWLCAPLPGLDNSESDSEATATFLRLVGAALDSVDAPSKFDLVVSVFFDLGAAAFARVEDFPEVALPRPTDCLVELDEAALGASCAFCCGWSAR